MRINKQLDREIRILCWCYEWFWSQILAEYKKETDYRSFHSLPKLYLLHSFYNHWRDKFQYFDSYDYFEDCLLFLGRPICVGYPLRDMSHNYRKISEFFLKEKRKPKKWMRHWYYDRSYSAKWQRQYEPDKETDEQKKMAREQKKEWRRRIGKDRDQGKGKRRSMYQWNNPRREHKVIRSRMYRQWIKRNIQKENFDIFMPLSKDREMFCDWKIWGW